MNLDHRVEVSRILGCHTHYEVFKLDRLDHVPVFADVQQVRRRYKELAIRVHPDKNPNTVHQPKTGTKSARQKCKYKRKRKTPSEPKHEETTSLPKRRRTPEEIWQEFQREEEELARQQFHTKGFDRFYESTLKRTSQVADASSTSTEEQQTILDSNLDAKASNWAAWKKPTSKRMRTESAVSDPGYESGTNSTTSDVPVNMICCMLCRRKFPSMEALHRHETLSKLHLANVEAQLARPSGDVP
ncbi:DnaJ domain [Phytophthora cactorum]|nr:DnaJ domain [Phytophthora cactorum]